MLVLVFVVMFFALDYSQGWNWETLGYSGFWSSHGMVRHLFFNGFHPVVPWLAFVLVGMGTLETIGRLENQTLPFALFASAAFCVAGVVFALLWRSRFSRGPLEAIMRLLTEPRRRDA